MGVVTEKEISAVILNGNTNNMWNKLDIKNKMDLMKTYRKGGFSYNDMVSDYNDSYQKFGNGGVSLPKNTATDYYTSDPNEFLQRNKMYSDSLFLGKYSDDQFKKWQDIGKGTLEIKKPLNIFNDTSKSGNWSTNPNSGELVTDYYNNKIQPYAEYYYYNGEPQQTNVNYLYKKPNQKVHYAPQPVQQIPTKQILSKSPNVPQSVHINKAPVIKNNINLNSGLPANSVGTYENFVSSNKVKPTVESQAYVDNYIDHQYNQLLKGNKYSNVRKDKKGVYYTDKTGEHYIEGPEPYYVSDSAKTQQQVPAQSTGPTKYQTQERNTGVKHYWIRSESGEEYSVPEKAYKEYYSKFKEVPYKPR